MLRTHEIHGEPNARSTTGRTGKQKKPRAKPTLELLEPRCLMTATPGGGWDDLLSVQAGCCCPICTGQALTEIPHETSTGAGYAASNPLSAIPQLNSRPGATRSIFLDFDGHTEASWGGYTNVVTRVFDRDGDAATFSAGELSTIQEIWTRVAEDYAPFNINVTTVQPPSFANGVAVRVAIGGNWSDWFGQQAGGVAYINGFTNSAPNVGYVFEDALGNGTARYVAEATSHEAGHMFGLLHQSYWVNGQLQAEYYEGNSAWAPIMGVGYYAARTTWHNGNTNAGPNSFQDDLAILSGANNAFGYRPDDFGSTLAAATALPLSGTSVNLAGLIGQNGDEDWFTFSTSGGALSLNLAVAQFGANLDSVLELRDASGGLVQAANPSNTLGASLAATLGSGTYFVVVKSSGGYGNLGQYTLTGTVPAPLSGGGGGGGGGGEGEAAPEISVNINSGVVSDGGTVNFGTTLVGTPVSRTFTVRNLGTGVLTLSGLSAMPSGFTLTSNLTSTSLAAGQTATFTVRFNAATAGAASGQIVLSSDDADEGSYEINLTGAANQPVVKILDNGQTGYSKSGSWVAKRNIGRDRDLDIAYKSTRPSATASASWNFTNLEPGQYTVHVTWVAARNQATNAPFTIMDGTSVVSTIAVNQRVAPSGLSADGGNWFSLCTVSVSGSSLRVTLRNNADGIVVADAVRIEKIGGSSAPQGRGAVLALGETVGRAEQEAGGALAATGLAARLGVTVSAVRPSAFSATAVAAPGGAVTSAVLQPELALLADALSLLDEIELATPAREGRATGELSSESDWVRDDLLASLDLEGLFE